MPDTWPLWRVAWWGFSHPFSRTAKNPGVRQRMHLREEAAQCEQVALLTALEKALKSRTRFTVQCMPNGCEIIDCDSGDLVQTIRLASSPSSRKD